MRSPVSREKAAAKIHIVVVPAAGEGASSDATVKVSSSIEEAIRSQGYDPRKMEVSVGDKPLTDLSQKITGGMTITLTERPAGS